jgi:hypothetical protein
MSHSQTRDNKPILRLPIRYYQIARLYGPGMEPSAEEGLHERMLEKPVNQVGNG